jgi:hypothetical protein
MDTYGETVTMEGDVDNVFKRIVPATATFTVCLHSPNYTTGQRTELISFYDQLSTGPEGRFYVTLWQYIGLAQSEMIFRGKIIADIGDLTLSIHRDLKITAICGLTDLRERELRIPAATVSEPLPFILPRTLPNIILEALKLSDVVKYFWFDTGIAASQPLFSSSINWESDQGFWHEHSMRYYWYEQFSPTYFKYKNAFEVLRQIAEGFNCRLQASRGMWHLEQLGYMDDAAPTRRGYSKTGATMTVPSKVGVNLTTNNDTYIAAEPSIRIIAPIKGVEYKNAKSYHNYLASTDLDITLNPGPVELGSLVVTGNRLAMELFWDVGKHTAPFPTDWSTFIFPFLAFPLMEFELKIGTNYAYFSDGIVEIKSSPTSGRWEFKLPTIDTPTPVLSWSLTPKKVQIIFPPSFSVLPPSFKQLGLTIESEVIPADGELTLTLTHFGSASLATGTLVKATIPGWDKWTWTSRSRILLGPDAKALTEPPQELTIYEIGDTRNTKIVTLDYGFYDGASVGGFNGLFVNWIPTSEWTDPESGLTLPLTDLVMKQVLAMRAKATKMVNLTILTKNILITGDARIQIGSSIFLPMKIEHDVNDDAYKISMWEIKKDFSGQIETKVIGDTPVPDYPTPIELDPQSPQSNVEQYYFEQSGVTDDHVVVDTSLAYYVSSYTTLIRIKSDWTVIIDGVVQHYVDLNTLTFPLSPGDLVPGQYSIDVDNDKFVFWGALDSQLVVIKYVKL